MVVLDAVGAILACAALMADRGSTFLPPWQMIFAMLKRDYERFSDETRNPCVPRIVVEESFTGVTRYADLETPGFLSK